MTLLRLYFYGILAVGMSTFISSSISADVPKINPFHFPSSVRSGGKATVTCLVESSLSSIRFRWLRNGIEVSGTSDVRIKNDTDFSMIVLDPVRSNSTGNYTCEAINSFGKDSYSTYLQVEGPPKWINEPNDSVLRLGDSLSLYCEASGYPVPKITWKKMKGELNEHFEMFLSKNSSFVIEHASSDHEGSYKCEADNGIQPSLEKIFKIVVIGKKDTNIVVKQ